jgi:hypothetical protein
MRYGRKDIKTDRADFESFLKAYRESAKASYEWEFSEKDYSAEVLDIRGVEVGIQRNQGKTGYFLSALEATAAHFLGKSTNTKTK